MYTEMTMTKRYLFDDIGNYNKVLALCSCSQHPYLNYLAQASDKEYLMGKYVGIKGFCNGTNCKKCRYGVYTGGTSSNNEIDNVSVFTCDYPPLVGDIWI